MSGPEGFFGCGKCEQCEQGTYNSRGGSAPGRDRVQGLQHRYHRDESVGKISEAVRSVVPESMWGAIIEKLEELEQHSQALDVGEDAFYADDPYDPTEFIHEDDEF
jgi:hypothetical protein